MRPVVVVGDVFADVVATAGAPLERGSDAPAVVSLLGGGSAANTACWLASLGVDVALVGRVGADALAATAAGDLPAYGVDARLAVDPAEPTGTCVVVVEPDGERTMLPDPGASAALSPADLPVDLFRPGTHLHLSGYALLRDGSRDAARTALARAAAMRMTVSVDAASVGPLRAAGPRRFVDETAGAALCLANEPEARLLAGVDDARAAAQRLADAYGEVVVKLGAGGALWHDGFVAARAPGEPVAGPVDTTGAGDAFAAGFLAEWLLHPEPETALAAGCRLAARAVAVVGGRPPAGRALA